MLFSVLTSHGKSVGLWTSTGDFDWRENLETVTGSNASRSYSNEDV